MLFSSTIFLFLFLPIVFLLYFLAKEKYRNVILLAASLYFYAYGEPKFIYVLLASMTLNYFFALGIEKTENRQKLRKAVLVVAIAANVAVLFVCKYLNFTITIIDSLFGDILELLPIALPIGISFYTFQAISYLIDVYRKQVKAQKNPVNLALYISFFPQLIAGPIVRYKTMAEALENRKESWSDITYGVRRFLVGLGKKIILSNNLSLTAEYAFGFENYGNLPVVTAWLGAISFSLQIYFDFSGYSDMAIGLGRIFGFHFDENFNYPYAADSITDFWRRWHISLSAWFRDYVYIPLGGSRVSTGRHIWNLFVVWCITGIWHGAAWNFVAWGLCYFVLLVLEKYILHPEKLKNTLLKLVYRIGTLLAVNFLWVFFNATEDYGMSALQRGAGYCLSMIGCNENPLFASEILFYVQEYGWFLLAAMIASAPVLPKIKELCGRNKVSQEIWEVLACAGLAVALLYSVANLVMGAHNPFIYFNF